MKNEEKNMTLNAEVKRAKWNLYDQVETATTELCLIPSVIQTLIDDLSLDRKTLTEEEQFNIALGSNKIYSVLRLTQMTIWNALEKLEEIDKAEISADQH